MESEKGIATNDASKTNLTEKLTMDNLPNFQLESNAVSDRTRRELLESTKLSRRAPINSARGVFPKLPAVVCVVCGGKLESDSDFLSAAKVCRECISHFTKVDSALNERATDKIRQSQSRREGGNAR